MRLTVPSLPDLPRNTRAGQFVDRVRRLGRVPNCVRDAFSWLPPAIPRAPRGVDIVLRKAMGVGLSPLEASDEDLLALDQVGRGRLQAYREWLDAGMPDVRFDTGPQPISGERCDRCVFQSPPWSQCYRHCAISWLHDEDSDCRAFLDRREFLSERPSYARFCRKSVPAGWPLDLFPEVFPGWKRWEELPTYTCNLPSGGYAMLGFREWYKSARVMYVPVERERLRRFAHWAQTDALDEAGVEAAQAMMSI
jgi:hypothetical protein